MSGPANIPSWQRAWLASRRNPHAFVTGVLGYLPHGAPNPDGARQLEAWQDEFLRNFKKHDRHSVRSGHSVGKGTMIAWLMLWFVLTHRDAKGILTAVSWDQMSSNNWAELRKQAGYLPEELRGQISIDEDKIFIKCDPSMSFFVRRSASKSKPEALQGIHAENILAICDEASGIDDIVFQIAESSSMATEGAMWCLFSNPTRRSGYFARTHHEMRERWKCWHVNCEDVPRAQNHIQDIVSVYGKSSNSYRVRVAGEFPTQDDETVIPLSLVMAAIGRDVEKSNVWPVWGLDVARFGDDTTALVMRQGNTLLGLREWMGLDGAQAAGRVIALYNAAPNDEKPREIVVDVIGVGASVYDILRLPGSPVSTIVTGANVAEAAAISEVDHRLRDEIWFRGRAWFADQKCHIPKAFPDPEHTKLIEKLTAELVAPTYDFTALGKRIVESKADMKKRGVPSPNIADAFLLSLLGGIYPRENPHRRREQSATASWMAA